MTSIIVPLTFEEEKLLIDYKNTAPMRLVRYRAEAILLHCAGVDIAFIGRLVNRKPSTITTWIRQFNATRLGSLFTGHAGNHNAAKLTEQQRSQVATILAAPPSAQGLDGQFWTVPKLRDWIASTFDVVYESDTSFHLMLRHTGLRFKLPATQNIRRQDEHAITERMQQVVEEIAPAMTDPDQVVFAADEVRIQFEAETRRAWIHEGDPGIIRVNTERQAQSYCGFLNNTTGAVDMIPLEWQNTTTIITALRELTKRHPNKRLTIVWDNARWHRSNELRDLLGNGNEFAHIHLVWMPPYAPDHNPIERVWSEAKQHIKNQQHTTFTETCNAFETFIASKTFNYRIHAPKQ